MTLSKHQSRPSLYQVVCLLSVFAPFAIKVHSFVIPTRYSSIQSSGNANALFKLNVAKEETPIPREDTFPPTNGTAFPPSAQDFQPIVNGETKTHQNQTTPTAPPTPDTVGQPMPKIPAAQLQSFESLAIDPSEIKICTIEPTPSNKTEQEKQQDSELIKQLPFVSMFRGSANYIANHRNTLAVYHIPGGLLDLPDPTVFRDLMNDVALTWLLGMRIVLVVGCRHQLEKRLHPNESEEDEGESLDRSSGLRVTEKETLRVVKEEAGYVRFEVERQLARSLRMQGGFSGASPMMDGNVVSGNFYSAQPFGILDGIDYQ